MKVVLTNSASNLKAAWLNEAERWNWSLENTAGPSNEAPVKLAERKKSRPKSWLYARKKLVRSRHVRRIPSQRSRLTSETVRRRTTQYQESESRRIPPALQMREWRSRPWPFHAIGESAGLRSVTVRQPIRRSPVVRVSPITTNRPSRSTRRRPD